MTSTRHYHWVKLSKQLALFLILAVTTAGALAQTDDGVTDTTNPEPPVIDPAIQAASVAYQNCVVSVMSTLESSAVKREALATKCAETQQALADAFPESIRELAMTQIERHIEASLYALEQIEGKVVEDTEDAVEIQQELEALETASSEEKSN